MEAAEKRMRREIANSNERRRMQSINAGFQSLRTLLPHHEGEKLSKAAILQQTAEYIYSLEQEKTRLLSQNCQLKRQLNQYEINEILPKKKKHEVVSAISESSDEAVSASPEPINIVAVLSQTTPVNSCNELVDLQCQLENERALRLHLEEKVRNLENQIYQEVQYHPDVDSLTSVIQESDDIEMKLVAPDSIPPVAQTTTIVCSPQVSRSPSPVCESRSVVETPQRRLPSPLEAAIKAEPKVEVERLPSPTPTEDITCSHLYVANTSRQNLETIVEAIRHLEGDHLFADNGDSETPKIKQNVEIQEVPLALTNKQIKVEVNPFLQFHSSSTVQQQQQHRPGVIVVKQHS